LFGLKRSGNDKADVETTISDVETFYHQIGMPANLKELGIAPTDGQIEELATKCTFFGKRTIGSFMKLGHEEIKKIYQLAK